MPDVPGLDVSGLQAWLHRAHPELQGDQLSARVVAGGKSNLTYAIDGGSIPLILRRPPLGHVLSSAHDMRREFRVISAVHGTGVPVPVAIDVVDDTDARQVTGTTFLLMERAPGLALSTRRQNAAFTASGLRALSVELVQHLADLHAIDPTAVGLADFGRPHGYLDRQLSTWRRQLGASRSRPLPELEALEAQLSTAVPPPGRTGIVHGDYRLDNVLVVGEGERPRVSAILDWEMATLGDPLLDLGIFALYWDIDCSLGPLGGALSSAVDSAAGYPTFGELLAVYAERAGIPVPDLRWYRAFAAYKLGVIAEGIHVRFLAGKTVGEGFDRLGDLVEPLAQHGLAQLEER